MKSFIGPALLGLWLIKLGMVNMNSDIASLHWYHRRRVIEENRLPFGRLIGLGTIICGISMVLLGCFSLLAEMLETDLYAIIGSVVLILGVIAGLILSFYAMIKYNKGIF